MNTMLDKLEAGMPAHHGKMRNRVGFIFVSSPNSVTPAHFDIEHSLLMQVSGSKTVSFGRFETDADRWHEVERYWDGSHGRIESLPPELASYPLTPGRGVYIPPVAPHWVHNGPAISLSVTLTYSTDATERENMIEAFNAHLRRLQITPRHAGSLPRPTWPRWPSCEPGRLPAGCDARADSETPTPVIGGKRTRASSTRREALSARQPPHARDRPGARACALPSPASWPRGLPSHSQRAAEAAPVAPKRSWLYKFHHHEESRPR